tara:strand:+ start:95 stop:469 length:375 start_codon:yes stop_codon:yes gene_type:complete
MVDKVKAVPVVPVQSQGNPPTRKMKQKNGPSIQTQIAYFALILSFLGAAFGIYGAFAYSQYADFECYDDDYLADNKYDEYSDPNSKCLDDEKKALVKNNLWSSIGSTFLFLGIAIMIGANRINE